MAIASMLTFVYFFFLYQQTHAEFPYLIKYDLLQTRNNVSESCAAQMDVFVTALSNFDMWAITMFDASSKIPSGILEGNVYDMGSFDQCVGIEHKTENLTIKGKHCLAALHIPLASGSVHHSVRPLPFNPHKQFRDDGDSTAGLSLALCIPNACKPTEVSAYLNIESTLFNDQQCQTYEKRSLDASDVACVIFLSIILFLMVTSTAYDVYLYKTNRSSVHQILLAFSVFTNGRKLLVVNTEDKRQLTCLHGLRCISMMWVIAGHRYSFYTSFPSVNMLDVLAWPTRLYTQYVQAAYLAVDTFFFLSGMMISYGYFSRKNKSNGVSFVPMYYVHRYLRLTPAVAALFIVVITIWRLFGYGPVWTELAGFTRDACLTWWWSLFLYVQNYVNYNEVCLITTWYLSADMQMYLLSPLIFLPLEYIMVRYSKKIVYGACASLVVLFMIIQIILKLNVESINEYMTHERLSIWMVGFTAGILLQEIKTRNLKVNMNPLLNLFTWVIVLVGMASIVLTMHDVRQYPEKNSKNMFDAFHRPAWGLGLAWIVYSCTIGHGSLVNWFLSLPAFHAHSRMTYSMYLVHIFVIFFYMGRTRTQSYFSDFNIFYLICGDIVCTAILALIWVLAFESPMIIIEKYIFGPCTGSKKDKENSTVKKTDLNVDATRPIP